MILVVSGDFSYFSPFEWCHEGLETTKMRQATVYEHCCDPREHVLYASVGFTKVDVATHLTLLLEYYPVTCIIATGNCGLLNPYQGCIGDVAISTGIFQHDLRFQPLGYPQGYFSRYNGTSSFVASNKDLIQAACNAADELGQCYHLGTFASGDQFVASPKQAEYLYSKFDALFVDSECGAISEVAKNYCLPLVSVKGISNYANHEGPADFRRFEDAVNLEALKVIDRMLYF